MYVHGSGTVQVRPPSLEYDAQRRPGNAGFRCLVSWLTYSDAPDGGSPIDEKACLEEIAKP